MPTDLIVRRPRVTRRAIVRERIKLKALLLTIHARRLYVRGLVGICVLASAEAMRVMGGEDGCS